MTNGKQITITIDPETGSFTCDLTGFNGHGCGDVIKMFESLGTVTESRKKPEYNQTQKQTQKQTAR